MCVCVSDMSTDVDFFFFFEIPFLKKKIVALACRRNGVKFIGMRNEQSASYAGENI